MHLFMAPSTVLWHSSHLSYIVHLSHERPPPAPSYSNHRLNEDGSYTVVWKSVKIDNSLNPIWAPVKIPMSALCNGDVHRPLKIEIFDWDSNSKHQSMGIVSMSGQCVVG